MPARDLFYVNNKYLHNANYYVCLGGNDFVASYADKILIGPVDSEADEHSEKQKFSKRAIIIPSSQFHTFVTCVKRAHNSFQDPESKIEPFQTIVYKHSKVHEISAELKEYENEFTFNLLIIWYFNKDKSWLKMCADNGLIDTQTMEGKDFTYLKWGSYLRKEAVEILEAHLSTVLECCFFENPAARTTISEFINFVMSEGKLQEYVKEKLANYSTLNYQMKIKVIRHILTLMFEKREKKEEGGNYEMKKYFDCLSRKVDLVFSLFNYHLKVLY